MQTGAIVVFTSCGSTRTEINAGLARLSPRLQLVRSVEGLLVESSRSMTSLFILEGEGGPIIWSDIELEPYTGNYASYRLIRGLVQSFYATLTNLQPVAVEDPEAYATVAPILRGTIESIRAHKSDVIADRLQEVAERLGAYCAQL